MSISLSVVSQWSVCSLSQTHNTIHLDKWKVTWHGAAWDLTWRAQQVTDGVVLGCMTWLASVSALGSTLSGDQLQPEAVLEKDLASGCRPSAQPSSLVREGWNFHT